MKSLSLSVVLAAMVATGATAQDWSGPYAGAGFSNITGESEAPWGDPGSAPTYGTGDDTHDLSGSGLVAVGGMNFQNGNLVFGAEVGLNAASVSGDDAGNSGDENGTDFSSMAYIAGRVGVALPFGMIYGSAGAARAKVDVWAAWPVGTDPYFTESVTHSGTRIAIGAEIPVGPGKIRVEGARTEFDAVAVTVSEEGDYYDIQSKPVLNEANVLYILSF